MVMQRVSRRGVLTRRVTRKMTTRLEDAYESMSTHRMDFTHDDARGANARRMLRAIVWMVLSVIALTLGWLGFRGYFDPELLFQFANSLYC
jgi:hypothetical protein